MPTALIDTNILVYASDPMDPVRQERAIDLLQHLDLNRSGRLSAQVLAEFISVSTRSQRPLYTYAQVIRQVERLLQTFPVFDLTPLIILEAARGAHDYSLSYYDAQIWAAARLNQTRVIFSEDFQHGQILEGIQFINPFLSEFDIAAWH